MELGSPALQVLTPILPMGFPGGSVVKNLLTKQKTRIQSRCREDSLEKAMATHSSVIAWQTPGTGSLVDYSPFGRKDLVTGQQQLGRCRLDLWRGLLPRGISICLCHHSSHAAALWLKNNNSNSNYTQYLIAHF